MKIIHSLVPLSVVLFLSACANLARHPSTPSEKAANVATPSSTNVVVKPIAEPKPEQQPAEANPDAQRSALLEADLNFSRMSEEKGTAQAFYEFLAPEGVSLFAGETPIRGRDAIKVHLAAGLQGFLTWQPTAADISRNGDMGFTWGTAIFQGKGTDDKPRISRSKYICVWKKQSNGRWKVVLFSNSPSPPPAEREQ